MIRYTTGRILFTPEEADQFYKDRHKMAKPCTCTHDKNAHYGRLQLKFCTYPDCDCEKYEGAK